MANRPKTNVTDAVAEKLWTTDLYYVSLRENMQRIFKCQNKQNSDNGLGHMRISITASECMLYCAFSAFILILVKLGSKYVTLAPRSREWARFWFHTGALFHWKEFVMDMYIVHKLLAYVYRVLHYMCNEYVKRLDTLPADKVLAQFARQSFRSQRLIGQKRDRIQFIYDCTRQYLQPDVLRLEEANKSTEWQYSTRTAVKTRDVEL